MWILTGIMRIYVEFEVPATVVMKSSLFLDITARSARKANKRFGGKCRLYLQG
jgi:hypothetical protein